MFCEHSDNVHSDFQSNKLSYFHFYDDFYLIGRPSKKSSLEKFSMQT